MERETGFEPATNSLEGCDSTPELLPHAASRRESLLRSMTDSRYRFPAPVIGGQGRIRTSVARSAADLQSAAINHSATCPSSKESNDPACARRFWSRRWDSNPQPSDYKSDALPLSYAGDLPAFKEHTIPRQARTAKCSSQHMSNQALSPGELRLCRTAS